jgi:hypothetical protein
MPALLMSTSTPPICCVAYAIAAAQAADSLSRLLPLAAQIVGELALTNGLGNAEKRGKAFDRLQAAAATEGIRAGASALNLAVEMAVAELKARAAK